MSAPTGPARYVLEQLLTNDGDQLITPIGMFWVDSTRCDCGDDNGIRFTDDYRCARSPDRLRRLR